METKSSSELTPRAARREESVGSAPAAPRISLTWSARFLRAAIAGLIQDEQRQYPRGAGWLHGGLQRRPPVVVGDEPGIDQDDPRPAGARVADRLDPADLGLEVEPLDDLPGVFEPAGVPAEGRDASRHSLSPWTTGVMTRCRGHGLAGGAAVSMAKTARGDSGGNGLFISSMSGTSDGRIGDSSASVDDSLGQQVHHRLVGIVIRPDLQHAAAGRSRHSQARPRPSARAFLSPGGSWVSEQRRPQHGHEPRLRIRQACQHPCAGGNKPIHGPAMTW